MGYIEANPGVHYTEIMKSLDLSNGTLSYHLSVLEKQKLIISKREGLYKLFYPRPRKKEDETAIKPRFFSTGISLENFKPSIIQEKIIKTIEEFQGISQIEIAEMLGLTKQSINYHIKKLRRAGIITVKKEKGSTRCFLIDKAQKIRQRTT